MKSRDKAHSERTDDAISTIGAYRVTLQRGICEGECIDQGIEKPLIGGSTSGRRRHWEGSSWMRLYVSQAWYTP